MVSNHTKFKIIVLLTLGVATLVAVGINHTRPPEPVSADSQPVEFSALRAFSHVKQIGRLPHPIGTDENVRVRDYLMDQITQLGFKAELQTDFVVLPGQNRHERVNNILVRVTGLKPGKAVLLAAHYDSVKTGPGAADNGASVAAVLETLRALKALPPLQNDLICLFTNGEEMNLLGAHAFSKHHPWMEDIALVLNFEYRGNSGAFLMFETSDGNGELIKALAEAVPFVQSNSLMYEVYRRLPNDTDFTVFKHANIPGMNFAAIEGFRYYHSPDDRPEHLNLGTVQHQGDIMLALVQHFGNRPLDNLDGKNRIYFDIAGLGLLHYPAGWAPYLAGLLALLWLGLAVTAYRCHSIRPLAVIAAVALFPLLVIGLYFVDLYVWNHVIEFLKPDETEIYFDNALSYAYLAGFVFVNLSVLAMVFVLAIKRLAVIELALGVAAIWLTGIILLNTNGASFLPAWPLFGVLIAWLSAKFLPLSAGRGLQAAVLFAGSIPGLLLFTPLAVNLFVALTAEAMPVLVTLTNLLAGLLLPLFIAIINPRLVQEAAYAEAVH